MEKPPMESTLGLLSTPVPTGLVEGLFARIREIELVEAETGGGKLANECRSFIESKGGKVEWMDVFTVAHAINGGVLLRESSPSSSSSSSTRPASRSQGALREGHGQRKQRSNEQLDADTKVVVGDGASCELTRDEISDIESMVKNMGLDLASPEA